MLKRSCVCCSLSQSRLFKGSGGSELFLPTPFFPIHLPGVVGRGAATEKSRASARDQDTQQSRGGHSEVLARPPCTPAVWTSAALCFARCTERSRPAPCGSGQRRPSSPHRFVPVAARTRLLFAGLLSQPSSYLLRSAPRSTVYTAWLLRGGLMQSLVCRRVPYGHQQGPLQASS